MSTPSISAPAVPKNPDRPPSFHATLRLYTEVISVRELCGRQHLPSQIMELSRTLNAEPICGLADLIKLNAENAHFRGLPGFRVEDFSLAHGAAPASVFFPLVEELLFLAETCLEVPNLEPTFTSKTIRFWLNDDHELTLGIGAYGPGKGSKEERWKRWSKALTVWLAMLATAKPASTPDQMALDQGFWWDCGTENDLVATFLEGLLSSARPDCIETLEEWKCWLATCQELTKEREEKEPYQLSVFAQFPQLPGGPADIAKELSGKYLLQRHGWNITNSHEMAARTWDGEKEVVIHVFPKETRTPTSLQTLVESAWDLRGRSTHGYLTSLIDRDHLAIAQIFVEQLPQGISLPQLLAEAGDNGLSVEAAVGLGQSIDATMRKLESLSLPTPLLRPEQVILAATDSETPIDPADQDTYFICLRPLPCGYGETLPEIHPALLRLRILNQESNPDGFVGLMALLLGSRRMKRPQVARVFSDFGGFYPDVPTLRHEFLRHLRSAIFNENVKPWRRTKATLVTAVCATIFLIWTTSSDRTQMTLNTWEQQLFRADEPSSAKVPQNLLPVKGLNYPGESSSTSD